MFVTHVSNKGGSVTLNEKHGVSCSYAVESESELLHTWITLPNGRQVQFFVNRETGLVVVDIINKKGTGGNEICRMMANEVKLP